MIDAHTFKVEDAMKYGVEKAVLLYSFEYWLAKNKANKKHFYDGYVWTYNSAKALSELFPYMNAKKISRIINELENIGALISGNYNKAGYDRTKWYTTPSFLISQNREMDHPDLSNGSPISEQPIPNNYQITTDTKDPIVPSETKRGKFKFSNDDLKLAEWFFSRVEILNPSAKKPNFENWANTVRLMREIDNRSLREISSLFDWANRDSFWCSNILSPEKLRKQWDKLSIRRQSNENIQQQNSTATRRLTAEEELNQRLLEQYGDAGSRGEREINPPSGVRMDEHQVSGSVREQMEQKGSTFDMEDWNQHSNN